MNAITMTGYMGAITAGAPFIMDYGQKDVEELVRVSDVQPADDVCCKVRLEGTTFWMPEIEFRRRATPVATPSQRLDAKGGASDAMVAVLASEFMRTLEPERVTNPQGHPKLLYTGQMMVDAFKAGRASNGCA